MLRYLADYSALFGPLRVFDSLTFRALLGLVLGFALTLLTGGRIIAWLRRARLTEDVSKPHSQELDDLHSRKAGTPTMGGLVILAATLGGVFLVCAPDNAWVLLGAGALVGFGLLGWIDDDRKMRGRGGLTKRQKMAGQIVLASLLAAGVAAWGVSEAGTRLLIPFTRWEAVHPDLGAAYWAYFVFVVVSCSNAVNLTDGLDGLASGCAIMVTLTFAILAYVSGNAKLCEYFRIPFTPGCGELAVFASVLVGTVMGFLWFNCHPAQVFMGDTGSLALGALIGYVALACRQELVILLAGGIFVLEAVSVLMQVASVRWRGARIFKCAPFHHHLEFSGWHENQVTTRLWLIGAILSGLGLATLKMH